MEFAGIFAGNRRRCLGLSLDGYASAGRDRLGSMRIIGFIEDQQIVKKILKSAADSNWYEIAIPA
jgi:hypothetical protein